MVAEEEEDEGHDLGPDPVHGQVGDEEGDHQVPEVGHGVDHTAEVGVGATAEVAVDPRAEVEVPVGVAAEAMRRRNRGHHHQLNRLVQELLGKKMGQMTELEERHVL